MREIMALADKANQYIDEKKPWLIDKEEGRDAELNAVCSMGLNLFRLLVAYLQPVLPGLAANAADFLNIAQGFFFNRGQSTGNISFGRLRVRQVAGFMTLNDILIAIKHFAELLFYFWSPATGFHQMLATS